VFWTWSFGSLYTTGSFHAVTFSFLFRTENGIAQCLCQYTEHVNGLKGPPIILNWLSVSLLQSSERPSTSGSLNETKKDLWVTRIKLNCLLVQQHTEFWSHFICSYSPELLLFLHWGGQIHRVYSLSQDKLQQQLNCIIWAPSLHQITVIFLYNENSSERLHEKLNYFYWSETLLST
jgi:hypothetical protein